MSSLLEMSSSDVTKFLKLGKKSHRFTQVLEASSGGLLEKLVLKNFAKVHRKASAIESVFYSTFVVPLQVLSSKFYIFLEELFYRAPVDGCF